jgi:hypothetical protein
LAALGDGHQSIRPVAGSGELRSIV